MASGGISDFSSIGARLHIALLALYRRMPVKLRRLVVRFVSPSFTVGAICLIERDDGHVLLLRQTYRSNWGLPGGLLKRGEDPAVAAAREVVEEVGLAIDVIGQPAVVVDPVPQRVDLIFRARPRTAHDVANVRPASPEIIEVRWFAPDELPELQFETAQALVELARSARAPQAHPLLSTQTWIERL